MRVGITDYAQDALGDIVYVTCPSVGDRVDRRRHLRRGRVDQVGQRHLRPGRRRGRRRNEALDATPELVNTDPYGEGWLFELRPSDAAGVDALLDAAAYRAAQLG